METCRLSSYVARRGCKEPAGSGLMLPGLVVLLFLGGTQGAGPGPREAGFHKELAGWGAQSGGWANEPSPDGWGFSLTFPMDHRKLFDRLPTFAADDGRA